MSVQIPLLLKKPQVSHAMKEGKKTLDTTSSTAFTMAKKGP